MKKKSLFIFLANLIFYFLIHPVVAQKLDIGIKSGINASRFDFSGSRFITGYAGGVFGTIHFNKFSIQPEVLYSQQGNSQSTTIAFSAPGGLIAGTYDVKTTLNYLYIPLLLKYNLTESFAVEAGAEVGFILAASTRGIPTVTPDITDRINKDYSLVMGFAYSLPMNLSLDARFNPGLNTTGYGTVKNQVIQITVNYKLISL
jgi:hypothetical protein